MRNLSRSRSRPCGGCDFETPDAEPTTGTGRVLVAEEPRRLTPAFWRLFTLLYAHRGSVIDNDRLLAELYQEME